MSTLNDLPSAEQPLSPEEMARTTGGYYTISLEGANLLGGPLGSDAGVPGDPGVIGTNHETVSPRD